MPAFRPQFVFVCYDKCPRYDKIVCINQLKANRLSCWIYTIDLPVKGKVILNRGVLLMLHGRGGCHEESKEI